MNDAIRRSMFCIFAAFAVAQHAHGQVCAGFTDVAAASSFCPNVEWMKNRGVTIGCTSTTLYCPNEVVSRVAMAVFMNRLGKALTPELIASGEISGAIALPPAAATPVRICQTPVSLSTPYPRSATIHGVISAFATANPLSWRGGLAISVQGGPWTSVANAELRASSAGDAWSFTAPDATIAVSQNQTLQVALTVIRDDVIAGTTGNFADSRCEVRAEIENQNGTSSPYDPTLAGVAP